MSVSPSIEYLRDISVTSYEDKQIRKLLRACFSGDEQACIAERRFFFESPMHRFVIWNDDKSELLAHLAYHEKRVFSDTDSFAVGAVAEVAVAGSARGQGWVRKLLDVAETMMLAQGMDHALLFGDTEVYSSSGYVATQEVHLLSDRPETIGRWVPVTTLYKSLTVAQWPAGKLYLPGKSF